MILMNRHAKLKPALLIVAMLLLCMLPSVAAAQGCALCVTQAAQGGHRFIDALRSGILVLVFPPMAISIGIIYISWRKRNQFREPAPLSSISVSAHSKEG
jgi:hypothetical protein